MTKQLEISVVLIELDALLDTRLATIASMGDDMLESVLKSNYHQRLMDYFPGIDNEMFLQRYANRDKAILENALITPMGQMLKEFTYSTLKQMINTPYHYQPKIMLNVHPYKLTEAEITVLIEMIINLTNGKADVQVVDVGYEDITPSYVKKHISIMAIYDCYSWLEIHSQNEKFKRVTCPEVTLLGPAIYFKKPERQPDNTLEAFEAMQTLASPLIGLRLLPVENFSMVFKRPEKPV